MNHGLGDTVGATQAAVCRPAPRVDAVVCAQAAGPDDLFALGRAAQAAARTRSGGRVVFARSRQLLATGAWRGPRDAADAVVEETDLAALGGWHAAHEAGARTIVLSSADSSGVATTAAVDGVRLLLRVSYRGGEDRALRTRRVGDIVTRARSQIAAVVPTPEGEPMGLDSLLLFATLRLALPTTVGIVADVARLGPRLAQMCLGFGADELYGPIVAERALRLGANAGNPALTRKEAAMLIHSAGWQAFERVSGGEFVEFES